MELLVVIAIVGLLVAMLLPAIQAARESARRTQCSNHLRQLTLAMISHESAHRFYPTGGWSRMWTGDTDRGFGRDQPGGWVFNILPFLEEQSLRELERGLQGNDRLAAVARRDATPLAVMNCPSRRGAIPYPNSDGIAFLNSGHSEFHARGDYAMNVGNTIGYEHWCGHFAPESYENPIWRGPGQSDFFSGISFCGSQVTAKQVKDGTSHTYAIGERYLDANHYSDGGAVADRGSMFGGLRNDMYRSTFYQDDYPASVHSVRLPHRDQAGLDLSEHFGSPHAAGFLISMCDGSVHSVPYDVDGWVHDQLGDRADQMFVPMSEIGL